MDYKLIASRYFNLGFNVSCMSYLKTKYNEHETNPDKAPCHQWIKLQLQKQTIEEFGQLPWKFCTGIGCIIGVNQIKCIDIDGCSSIKLIHEILNIFNLPTNYEWVVKTPNGFHIYIKSDDLYFSYLALENGILAVAPNENYKNEFKRIELRWSGHCVLPPSAIQGKEYSFFNQKDLPEKEIKYVNQITLFKVVANMCGIPKTDKITNTNVANPDFRGEIFIGDYFIRLFPSSELYYNLQQYKSDKLIYEANQRKGENWIGFRDRIKPSHIIFIYIEVESEITNELDYSNYPRIRKMSYHSENKNETEIRTYLINTNSKNTLNEQNKEDLEDVDVKIETALANMTNLFLDISSHLIIFNHKKFCLSIFDSEYLRINERNPLRDLNTFCIKEKMENITESKFSDLSDLYEYLFNEKIVSKTAATVKECYDLMNLYGFTR